MDIEARRASERIWESFPFFANPSGLYDAAREVLR